jgi:hypothetical protein
MEPEKKKKRLEDEYELEGYEIIDERAELAKVRKQAERQTRKELRTMTDDQRAELKSQAFQHIALWGVASAAMLSFLLIFAFFPDIPSRGELLLIGLVSVGTSMLFGGLAFNKWTQVAQDLREGEVNYAEGTITLDIRSSRRSNSGYKLSVGRHTFDISKKLFLSLSNHQPYRVYYSPRSRFVLGAEPL